MDLQQTQLDSCTAFHDSRSHIWRNLHTDYLVGMDLDLTTKNVIQEIVK